MAFLCQISSVSGVDLATFRVSAQPNTGGGFSGRVGSVRTFSSSLSPSTSSVSSSPSTSSVRPSSSLFSLDRSVAELTCAANASLDFWWSSIPLLRPALVLNGVGLLLIAIHTLLWMVHPAARGQRAAAVTIARLLRYTTHVAFVVALILAIILAQRSYKNSPFNPIASIVACLLMYACLAMPDVLLLFESHTFLSEASQDHHGAKKDPLHEDL